MKKLYTLYLCCCLIATVSAQVVMKDNLYFGKREAISDMQSTDEVRVRYKMNKNWLDTLITADFGLLINDIQQLEMRIKRDDLEMRFKPYSEEYPFPIATRYAFKEGTYNFKLENYLDFNNPLFYLRAVTCAAEKVGISFFKSATTDAPYITCPLVDYSSFTVNYVPAEIRKSNKELEKSNEYIFKLIDLEKDNSDRWIVKYDNLGNLFLFKMEEKRKFVFKGWIDGQFLKKNLSMCRDGNNYYLVAEFTDGFKLYESKDEGKTWIYLSDKYFYCMNSGEGGVLVGPEKITTVKKYKKKKAKVGTLDDLNLFSQIHKAALGHLVFKSGEKFEHVQIKNGELIRFTDQKYLNQYRLSFISDSSFIVSRFKRQDSDSTEILIHNFVTNEDKMIFEGIQGPNQLYADKGIIGLVFGRYILFSTDKGKTFHTRGLRLDYLSQYRNSDKEYVVSNGKLYALDHTLFEMIMN